MNTQNWRKSTRSAGNGNCVEVAFDTSRIGMRDSKSPADPALAFDVATWRAFVADLKSGAFDQP